MTASSNASAPVAAAPCARARARPARLRALSRPARSAAMMALLGVLLCVPFVARAQDAATRLSDAERLWQTRAAQLDDRLAFAEPTERALEGYTASIDPEAPIAVTLEPRWKALRAAHYLSEFTNAPAPRRDEAVGRATDLADRSLAALAAEGESLIGSSDAQLEAFLESRHLDRGDLAQLYFWSAIVWGAHGQRVGLLTIVREGIARRIYEYASLAIRIDATIERGGAYRLLSRLNAELPRVPFVSGWVDREKTLPQAEAAFGVDPADPGNRMILALALLDREPERHDEARALLRAVSEIEPRPSLRAEDLAIRKQATELRAELRGSP